MNFSPESYLDTLADLKDEEINLAEAGLALAAYQRPDINLDRYLNHIKRLANEVSEHHAALLDKGANDDLGAQLAALKYVLADEYDYTGDRADTHNIDNASLIRVIDEAKGLSITLALLYMQSARAQGWNIEGLDIPGRFVCRLEQGGERLIFDPFENCKVLDAPDLRQMLKEALGDEAELSASYYDPVTNRQILVGLQNFIKFRKIAMEDYEGALEVVDTIRKIDPNEYRLLLDAGVLNAKLNQPQAAIEALEGYLTKAPHTRDRYEAEALLYELRRSLN
ncbi:MAG: transglutaminase-like domain-containing protein [Pseudomonadota bacterium]